MPLPDPDRPLDVLDADVAGVAKRGVDPVADAFIDDGGDADAARLGERLEARGDVDAVAIDVVAFDDHVAQIDADAQNDPRLVRVLRLLIWCRAARALHHERAVHGIDHAAELRDGAVADQLDDAAVMGGDGGIEHRQPVQLEGGQGALLVGPHQPRIADHVGREDGRELTVDAFFGHEYAGSGSPQPRAGQPQGKQLFGKIHGPAADRGQFRRANPKPSRRDRCAAARVRHRHYGSDGCGQCWLGGRNHGGFRPCVAPNQRAALGRRSCEGGKLTLKREHRVFRPNVSALQRR